MSQERTSSNPSRKIPIGSQVLAGSGRISPGYLTVLPVANTSPMAKLKNRNS